LLSSRSERVAAPLISVTGDALAAGTAPLASIVLGANRAFLLARINALATDGKASINLRPRVVTLDNVEAVLQSTREFYVRVTGQYAGDLFKVEAGLTLRVTPSVVIDGASVQYKLLVRIDDGSVSTSSLVDGLPSVSRSSISASVTIGEGESLFIGGLISETSSAGSAGVPFLSKVPVLGALFGTRSSEVRKSERMFLITPKLVRPI
jgi:type III secretion protein C